VKRFAGTRHYLDSQAQSEQAAALKTTTLCRAVVCSHWLVRDRQGTLLGELCSSACPSNNLFVLPLLPYAFPLSSCRSQGHLAGLAIRPVRCASANGAKPLQSSLCPAAVPRQNPVPRVDCPRDSAIWRGDGLPGKREKRRARSNKRRLQGSQSAETSQTSKRRICRFPAW